ncbi:MAG: hypothetical protein LBU89_06715, partial [Fibromonadaceae bacterium]|nr:hypothetical protein [Fibromonadaceae bacterium]
ELTPEQRNEFAKLEIKDIYPEFYILKVDRFRNLVKSKLDEWMYFLKNSSIKPKFKAPGLLEANEKLEYSRLSRSERRAYDRYVDNIRSNDSTIYTAKLKGKAEGKAESRMEIARKLKSSNVPIDIIVKATGLSKREIDSLRRE